MDAIITSVITQLPNFAIAVWCIYNYQVTIKGLLDQQTKLLDQLMQAKGLKVEEVQNTELAATDGIKPK